ncbi:hypothetical protein EB232_08820 [Mesorhizobium sp. NZP2077]|nr:hypothetical protein EB232_08820 [Mesorhizobium sp. NZP2077]
MNSVPTASMATTVVGMTAIAIIPGVATIAAAARGLTLRAVSWLGQDHTPKEKSHCAGKHQQQDSEMHPSGRVHLNSHLFPRLGRQFNSTMWM